MERIKFSLFDRIRVPAYDSLKHMRNGDLDFDRDKCRECGICVQLCPGGCLLTDTTSKMDIATGRAKGGKYGVPRVDRMKSGATLCIACFDCGAGCPHGAISMKSNFNPGLRFKRLTQTNDTRFPKRY